MSETELTLPELYTAVESEEFFSRIAQLDANIQVRGLEAAFTVRKTSGRLQYSDLFMPANREENHGSDPTRSLRVKAFMPASGPRMAMHVHSHPTSADYTTHKHISRADIALLVAQNIGHISGIVTAGTVVPAPQLDLYRTTLSLDKDAALRVSSREPDERIRQLARAGILSATVVFLPHNGKARYRQEAIDALFSEF